MSVFNVEPMRPVASETRPSGTHPEAAGQTIEAGTLQLDAVRSLPIPDNHARACNPNGYMIICESKLNLAAYMRPSNSYAANHRHCPCDRAIGRTSEADDATPTDTNDELSHE
jgi:hypothetical protein